MPKESMSWSQNLAGFLVMCWGGNLLTHFLLCIPPAQLVSVHPWIVYSSVHALLSVIDWQPSPWVLDTFLPPIDGVLRSGAVIGGVTLAKAHPSPAVSQSVFAQLVIGAISAGGGGLVASSLGVWEPDWRLRTPPVLKKGGNTFVGTLEFWSGSIAALLYGFLMNTHKEYSDAYGAMGFKARGVTTPLGARAFLVVFLTFVYGYRAFALHWWQTPKAATPARSAGKKKTQ